jgi:hypothetical protein
MRPADRWDADKNEPERSGRPATAHDPPPAATPAGRPQPQAPLDPNIRPQHTAGPFPGQASLTLLPNPPRAAVPIKNPTNPPGTRQ